MGGFQPEPPTTTHQPPLPPTHLPTHRYNYEGVAIFQFNGFPELPKTNFPNRRFRRAAFSVKNRDFDERRLLADFCPISTRCDDEVLPFSKFTILRASCETNFPNRRPR